MAAPEPTPVSVPLARPAVAPVHPELGAPVAVYEYVDEFERFLYLSARFVLADGSKTFRQARPDGKGGWSWKMTGARLVPYRLPQLLEAVAAGREIFIVEGEKDVESLEVHGYSATTNPMGAGKWQDGFAAYLRGAQVVVLPDNDKAGRSHGDAVANSCFAAGCRVRLVELPDLPEKGDVTDWLDRGHDLDELDRLVSEAKPWRPAGYVQTLWRLDELWADPDVMRPPPIVVPSLAWASRSTLFASAEKAGKSTVMGYVAAAVSRGTHFLGNAVALGVVLIVGLEEFVGDVAIRLRQFDADPERVYVLTALPAKPEDRPAAIADRVREVGATLVVVDTLVAYLGGTGADLNKAGDVGPIVYRLTDVARDTGAALVLTHHAKKDNGEYRDSSAIGGGVDVIAEMFVPEKDSDPSLRRVRVRGRIPSSHGRGFEFRYDGRHLRPVAPTSAPLDQRITDFVRSEPGASLRRVTAAVVGRAEDINRTVLALVQGGQLANYGRGDAFSLHVPAPQLDVTGPNLNGNGRTHAGSGWESLRNHD